MDVVDEYLDGKDADLVRRLFQDGKVVVEGQVMTPINPNTIPYTENHVRFVKPFTPYDVDVDEDSWRRVMDTRVNGTFLSHKHLSVIGSLRVSMKAWLMLVLRRASWLSRSELSTDQVRRTSRK